MLWGIGQVGTNKLSGSFAIRNSDFSGFRPIFGQTRPQNPSRTTGLVLQCRLHQKSAPQRLRSRRYTGTVRTVKVKNAQKMDQKWSWKCSGECSGTNECSNKCRKILRGAFLHLLEPLLVAEHFCIYWSICYSQSIPQSISQTIFGPFVEHF